MPEQLYLLNGESWDLDELAFMFQEGVATVKRTDDAHYLSVQVEGGEAEDQLLDFGDATLKRMNAICLVRDGRFRPPKMSGLSWRNPETGKITTTVKMRGHIQIRGAVRATLTVLNSDGTPKPRQPTFGESAFRLSLTNDALRETLRAYATIEHDWRGLYLVFESVKKANSGKLPSAWAPRVDVEKFKSTANSYAAIGPAARHGFGVSGVPAPLITIEEAQDLVRKILHAWIDALTAHTLD